MPDLTSYDLLEGIDGFGSLEDGWLVPSGAQDAYASMLPAATVDE